MNEIKPVNIVIAIILTIFTFGLYYLYWQYRQFKIINKLLKEDKNSFLLWFFLSIITFGIYHIYHEYVMSNDILYIQEKYGTKRNSDDFPVLCLILSVFGFFIISDIIHQEELNKIINSGVYL